MSTPAAPLTLTILPAQLVAVERFREALAAGPNAVTLSMEDAARVLFSTACAAWMDVEALEAEEITPGAHDHPV